VDFYCHKTKLIIEIDGDIHNTKKRKEYDKNRSYKFEQFELTILRLSNEDVQNNINSVLTQIKSFLPLNL
jgi:very-short-patch-repair endonuclease